MKRWSWYGRARAAWAARTSQARAAAEAAVTAARASPALARQLRAAIGGAWAASPLAAWVRHAAERPEVAVVLRALRAMHAWAVLRATQLGERAAAAAMPRLAQLSHWTTSVAVPWVRQLQQRLLGCAVVVGRSVAWWVDHVLLLRAETLGGEAVALLEHVAAAASFEMRRLRHRVEALSGEAAALLEHFVAATLSRMARLRHWAEAFSATSGIGRWSGWGEWVEERAGWGVWAKEWTGWGEWAHSTRGEAWAGWGKWADAWAGWGRWKDIELAWQVPRGTQWWHTMAVRVWRQGQRLGSWMVHTAVGQGCRAAALISAWWLDGGQVEHVMCM